MTRITLELIRKKAEHHDGRVCPRIQILLLTNNIIQKIENIKRLKDLVYLNLAMNLIKVIEGISSCEKLRKLDLTLNFIYYHKLELSLKNLQPCSFLRELYLTGNPCADKEIWPGYRSYVINQLPQLEKLDGEEIKTSDKIEAKRQESELQRQLAALSIQSQKDFPDDPNSAQSKLEGEGEEDEDIDESELTEEQRQARKVTQRKHGYTAEARLQMHKEMEEEEARVEAEKKNAGKFAPPPDVLKEAQQKLNMKAEESEDGKLPSQRNTGRYEFSMTQTGGTHIVVDIAVPRFMDTSLIDVDIRPKWFQCIIKGKNLLMHLEHEVYPERSKIQRIQTNGHLVLTMPLVNAQKIITPVTNASDKKTVKSQVKQNTTSTSFHQNGSNGEQDYNDVFGETEIDADRNKENKNNHNNMTNSTNSGLTGPGVSIRNIVTNNSGEDAIIKQVSNTKSSNNGNKNNRGHQQKPVFVDDSDVPPLE